MNADAPPLVPVGDKASAFAVADEVGFEPAGEAMLTGGSDEPVGDEHEGAVGEGDAFGASEVLVEDVPETELLEEGADDEDRSPVRGVEDLGLCRDAGFEGWLAGEEPLEFGEEFADQVLASEIGDNALLDLTVVAVGFDNADVFVDRAAGRADFDGSGVHEGNYHDEVSGNQGEIRRLSGKPGQYCHYTFGVSARPPPRIPWKTRGFCAPGPPTRAPPPQTWAIDCPAGVHGYGLDGEQVQVAELKGIITSRRLDADVLAALCRAASRLQAAPVHRTGERDVSTGCPSAY